MAQMKTPGRCRICNEEVTKRTFRGHLQKKHAHKNGTMRFLIEVTPNYPTQFWLMLLVNPSATLEDLDDALRDIWLECCGHLSAFTIQGTEYSECDDPDDDWGEPRESLDIAIEEVLTPGMTCKYEYDFGDTTELKLKVLDSIAWEEDDTPVLFVGRNDAPHLPCQICGKNATTFCMECQGGDEWILCDECLENHECDEGMFIRITNSPRSGQCAYDGGRYDEEEES